MTVGTDPIAPSVPGNIVPQESVGIGVQPARGGGMTNPVTSAVELSGRPAFHRPGSKKLDELFLPVRWMKTARKILM